MAYETDCWSPSTMGPYRPTLLHCLVDYTSGERLVVWPPEKSTWFGSGARTVFQSSDKSNRNLCCIYIHFVPPCTNLHVFKWTNTALIISTSKWPTVSHVCSTTSQKAFWMQSIVSNDLHFICEVQFTFLNNLLISVNKISIFRFSSNQHVERTASLYFRWTIYAWILIVETVKFLTTVCPASWWFHWCYFFWQIFKWKWLIIEYNITEYWFVLWNVQSV